MLIYSIALNAFADWTSDKMVNLIRKNEGYIINETQLYLCYFLIKSYVKSSGQT